MTVEPFKAFIKKEGTTQSSKIMWFVVFVCDPESPFRNLPEELRIQTLLDNKFITPEEYKKNKDTLIKELKTMYYSLVETPAMRQLRIWSLKMDEKSAFMETTTYDVNTFEILEKMMASNAKIYSDLEMITKKIATEDDTITRGGAQESLTDKGQI
jgi:hypothetical protein